MSLVQISDSDIKDAEQFLVDYLLSKGIDVDLSHGTVARDILVTGLALISAYLRSEAEDIKTRLSIRRLSQLVDSPERDQAIDDILSNLFISRKDGRESKGVITLHFTNKADVLIPTAARFYRTSTLGFKPDADVDTLYFSTDLVENRDENGNITSYSLDINVVSLGVGEEYNINPGIFSSFTQVNPYLFKVENKSPFSGGANIETTDELLSRAQDAITLRGLISDKSISTTLKDNFSSIVDVVVVGIGDDEMRRDLTPSEITPIQIHTGGYVDIYVSTPLVESAVYEATVGGTLTYPGNEVLFFKDSSVTNFQSAGVQAGDILKIKNPAGGEPDKYVILKANDTTLEVNIRTPFPRVRDLTDPVEYSVGRIAPDYNDVISSGTTGEFSKTFSVSGIVPLPSNPIFKIKDVSISDPSGKYTDSSGTPLASIEDNRIHLINRDSDHTNEISAQVNSDPEDLRYKLVYFRPEEAQSSKQLAALAISSQFDGETVRIVYDTITDYVSIDTYVSDEFNRVVAANMLVRAFNPIYINLYIEYSLKNNADSTSIDEVGLKTDLVNYVNSFPATDVIDVSDIIDRVYSYDSNIGSVLPYFIKTDFTGEDLDITSYNTVTSSSYTFTFNDVGKYIEIENSTYNNGEYKILLVDDSTNTATLEVSSNLTTETSLDWTLKDKVKYGLGYTLYAPDGSVIKYFTTDKVSIGKDYLVNPEDPNTSLDVTGAPTSISLGVSDRTVQYFLIDSDITLVQV